MKLIIKKGKYLDQLSETEKWVCSRLMPKYLKKTYGITPKEYYDKVLGITETPVCTCGAKLKFIRLSKGYQSYCSISCSMKNHKNALGSSRPDLAEYNRTHKPALTPEKYSENARKRNKKLNSRIKGFLVSKNEFKIYNYLISKSLTVVPQYKVVDTLFSNHYHRYDMMIKLSDSRILIEYDGTGHVGKDDITRKLVADKLNLPLLIITESEFKSDGYPLIRRLLKDFIELPSSSSTISTDSTIK